MTKLVFALLFAAVPGCGRVEAIAPDAGDLVDSLTASPCDPTAPFDPPVLLAGFDTDLAEFSPRLSPDELTLYVGLADSNSQDLYVATRITVAGPFGTPARLAVSGTANELTATVSADGLTLVFESNRDGDYHLYVATRTSPLADFGPAAPMVGVNSTGSLDVQPHLGGGGQALWFVSTRPGGGGSWNIYRAARSGAGFGSPAEVMELTAGVVDQQPVVSDDERTIYFASSRAGGLGAVDIWTSHRSDTSSPFPPPTPALEVNSDLDDFPGWLSPDGCRLYLASGLGGDFDIFVAVRR